MKSNIDKDFYCTAGHSPKICGTRTIINKNKFGKASCLGCIHCHYKHPTFEQFKEEYGEDWTGPVFLLNEVSGKWEIWNFLCFLHHIGKNKAYKNRIVVCACTPYAEPDEDWRPQ